MLDTTARPKAAPQARKHNQAPLIEVRDLNMWYGKKQALKDVCFDLYPNEIVAFIGPSGCGKTTALKCLNRMHDDVRGVRITGLVEMEGQDIYGPDIDPPMHRRRFGWVAQKPNPFAKTIYENVAYAARLHGLTRNEKELSAHVEDCLRRAHLWDEVKDTMRVRMGYELSGGQQQRLCIARALATRSDILLMDEPTGSIDPIATAKIEELMIELRETLSIVVITHSMNQARRVADRVAYYHLGELREIGPTEQMFTAAMDKDARNFIAGKFG